MRTKAAVELTSAANSGLDLVAQTYEAPGTFRVLLVEPNEPRSFLRSWISFFFCTVDYTGRPQPPHTRSKVSPPRLMAWSFRLLSMIMRRRVNTTVPTTSPFESTISTER